MPRLHSETANDRPEPTKLQPVPEVVEQQPQEIHSTNIHKTSTTEVNKNTHMPESKQRNDVQSKTSPRKETSSKVSGSSMEPLLATQTGSTLIQCPNDSMKQQQAIQRNETDVTTYDK